MAQWLPCSRCGVHVTPFPLCGPCQYETERVTDQMLNRAVLPLGRRHGTNSAYSWGCRCRDCTQAHADYGREWARANADVANARKRQRYARRRQRDRYLTL